MAKETKDRLSIPSRFLAASDRVLRSSTDPSHEPTPTELRARYERNRELVRGFVERAKEIKAGFSILLYGGTAYGYNPNASEHSSFDDVDMGLILTPNLTAEQFLEQARYVFGAELRVNINYVKGIIEGKWDMCRMYGKSGDVDLEFFIMSSKTFRSRENDAGSTRTIRDIGDADLRIPMQKHWSIRDWKEFMNRLNHREETWEDGTRHMVVDNFFLSPDGSTLGSIGVPLLQAESVYDPSSSSKIDEKALHGYWHVYVRACLAAHPELTNDQIIDSLARSKRFSVEYRARLSARIDEIRYALSQNRS